VKRPAPARSILVWLGAAALGLAGPACPSRDGSDIAELTSVLSGQAERSGQGEAWQASRAGDRFREGDAVRTSADGGARLRFLAGGGLRMGPSTTIRFGAGRLAVDGELEAEGEQAIVELEVGRAHIAPGSRIRIGQRGDQVQFDVLVGSAVVSREQHRVEMRAGEAVAIEVGGSRVERTAARAGGAAGAGGAASAGGAAGAGASGAAGAGASGAAGSGASGAAGGGAVGAAGGGAAGAAASGAAGGGAPASGAGGAAAGAAGAAAGAAGAAAGAAGGGAASAAGGGTAGAVAGGAAGAPGAGAAGGDAAGAAGPGAAGAAVRDAPGAGAGTGAGVAGPGAARAGSAGAAGAERAGTGGASAATARIDTTRTANPGAAGSGAAIADTAGAAGAASTGDAGAAAGTGRPVGARVRGAAVRARRPGGEWSRLRAGNHELAAGTELSIPRGSTVELARGGEHAIVHGAAEAVVAPGGHRGALVETRSGRADVRAAGAEVSVRVPGGMIVARRGHRRGGAGSRAGLRVERGEARVVVTGGVIDVVGDQGGTERLLTGQSGVVERGGLLRITGRPPGRADFSIRAGLSATIHDPTPPSDVRVEFGGLCPGAGVLELLGGDDPRASRMVQGRGAAIGRFPRGSYRYRVRCFEGDALGDAAVASGRLVVNQDSGTRPIALQAPHNFVDADGRRYTVLYQNQLPSITFRWQGAPEASGYRLMIAPAAGRRIDLALTSSSHTVGSGALAEGQYQYWFQTVGRAVQRESRHSTLTIDFDNAAGSGYLIAPRPDERWNGESVLVRGGVSEGWRVSVRGKPLALDRQHRFSSPVARAADENGIAVEFRHPSHGVHLYVRRARRR